MLAYSRSADLGLGVFGGAAGEDVGDERLVPDHPGVMPRRETNRSPGVISAADPSPMRTRIRPRTRIRYGAPHPNPCPRSAAPTPTSAAWLEGGAPEVRPRQVDDLRMPAREIASFIRLVDTLHFDHDLPPFSQPVTNDRCWQEREPGCQGKHPGTGQAERGTGPPPEAARRHRPALFAGIATLAEARSLVDRLPVWAALVAERAPGTRFARSRISVATLMPVIYRRSSLSCTPELEPREPGRSVSAARCP